MGEIDLVALRGKRLALVEVKPRKTFDEAGWSLPTRARRRIVRAAQYWLAGHPDFAGHDIAFDVVLTAPWAWPRYIETRFLSDDHTGSLSLPGLTRHSIPLNSDSW